MVASSRQHLFARLPDVQRPRSTFDRSHGYKTTFDAGYLIPFYVDEALPGDTINCGATAFARLATPLHPFMDNMYMTTFFFSVPLRLVWNNFQRFMGEQPNPGDSTDFVTPKVSFSAGGPEVGSLYDYFGLPTDIAAGYGGVNNFHARAYNLIWNEWFRDQNLQTSATVDLDDGPDDPADYVVRRRGKRHDYFTSATPEPQKGPAVELPLSGNAPVLGIGVRQAVSPVYNQAGSGYRLSDGTTGTGSNWYGNAGDANALGIQEGSTSGYPGVYANMANVSSATINELREAITIQQFYELDMRGGTRYTESVYAHFGVRSDDARLQRPEYLGGATTNINVSPVAQMSSTTEDSPQGNLAAIGTASFRHGFTKSFTEHCVVIGLVCAHADLNYQQGVNKMFTRSTRFDYYDPIFANLGEQAVLNKEIFVQGTSADDEAFGYQERWAEYRYKPSSITGQFRSTYAQSLDTWHLAQEFGSLPTLNSTFIEENPPVDRVIAVETEPHFLFDSMLRLRTARVMPLYSVPGLTRL